MGKEKLGRDFKIVTGEKENIIIILFIGQIRSQEVSDLEQLLVALIEKPQTSIILSFRDVTQFMPGAHGAFARIQTSLRKAGKLLAMASLKPEIKSALLSAGVLRESEVFNNIPESWQALKVRLQDSEIVPSIKKAA
jgi:anti-anti-sigma regulatory factor